MTFKKAVYAMIRPVRSALLSGHVFAKGNASANSNVRKEEVLINSAAKKPNPAWPRTGRGTIITLPKNPLIKPGAKVFAMGSCFAVEIRDALRGKGFNVLPRYFDLSFDPARQSPGKLPRRDNINHYDTFTIRQEFEMAFGGRGAQTGDFWEVTSATVKSSVDLNTNKLFQDPHRKRIFASSMEDLAALSANMDACIREGIKNADVYIITLGLIEVWRNRRTGKYLCMAPGRGQTDDAEFILSDFQDNMDNMRRVCGLIRDHAPGRKIILTVSPVPLARTFTDKDVVIANMESKSLLRAVSGQLQREFDNVIYWPSYEIAAREDIYEEDGRHVRRESVDKIVNAFIDVHCAT